MQHCLPGFSELCREGTTVPVSQEGNGRLLATRLRLSLHGSSAFVLEGQGEDLAFLEGGRRSWGSRLPRP